VVGYYSGPDISGPLQQRSEKKRAEGTESMKQTGGKKTIRMQNCGSPVCYLANTNLSNL
jgi:hypothetical protein